MYDEIRDRLRDVAQKRETIHYGDIALGLGLDMEDPADRVRIGEILGEISKEEHKEGHPMLSVVVTHKGDERPGHGFYDPGEELGLVKGSD